MAASRLTITSPTSRRHGYEWGCEYGRAPSGAGTGTRTPSSAAAAKAVTGPAVGARAAWRDGGSGGRLDGGVGDTA
ncbi:hypothetical protein TPA0910_15970 [Streptomyces hygroscopicus subsp. sporocinereus]|uniref:Uncharacterized protein n=1 Tax=Streptomyces hygroscopicus TaxID=1912 RepID=A0ABQ3TUZ6_STRHY|nr:hypothetical protein TPA0910_15970 [Streptomyces hygroscopicus]